jgi:uncharacterized protein (PEP-CTERM system associated)
LLADIGGAAAFPFFDPTNTDTVPGAAPLGTELPATDVTGLRNQLRLVNPAAAGNPSAWTIVPRLTLQEMFTDNAYEVSSPRSPDAVTIVAPGVKILADTARLRMSLDYQPNLLVHAINGPLNSLTQQLTASGLLTVAPDFAYVDVTAISGVQSRLGALAGTGTLGAGNAGLAPATATNAASGGTGQGLNRDNEVQTSSFGISPYLLRQFGDYGSGKLGASVNASSYSSITGFAASPLPTGGGGNGSSSLLTTEQIAHYATGEAMQKLQYSLDVDLSQSHTQTGSASATAGTTTVTEPGTTFTSERQTLNNQLSYAVSHSLILLGAVGEQHIQYSGNQAPTISGLIWNVGFTYTPSPDSTMTVTYGRLNGTNAAQASGHFAVGGRSLLTFSYSNTVGTQLENLQNQINNAAIGAQGGLVTAQTGGPALIGINALGVQNGVYRFSTFNTAFSTQWDRDSFQATLTWSEQSSVTPTLANTTIGTDAAGNPVEIPSVISTTGPTSAVWTAGAYWTHIMSEDLTLSTSASYSFIHRSGNLNDGSLATAVGLQYTLSPSTTLSARYSFFDRVSKIPGYTLYENILLLGATKQF